MWIFTKRQIKVSRAIASLQGDLKYARELIRTLQDKVRVMQEFKAHEIENNKIIQYDFLEEIGSRRVEYEIREVLEGVLAHLNVDLSRTPSRAEKVTLTEKK